MEFYDVSISRVGNNHASEPCEVRAALGDKDGSRMATDDLATCDKTSPLRLHNIVFDNWYWNGLAFLVGRFTDGESIQRG